MKKIVNILILIAITFVLASTNVYAINISKNKIDDIEVYDEKSNKTFLQGPDGEDLDPNADIEISVNIKGIRALDDFEKTGGSDFYVRIYINDKVYKSEVWDNQKYLYGAPYIFQAESDVPDNEEDVAIKIQLWDKQFGADRLCDISDNFETKHSENCDIDILYNIKTGSWRGEDYIYNEPIYFDESGYGRLCGTDDNSIYENDRDCELWFDITQSDTDGDGIPYWTEVNVYRTDPMVDDTGRDDDEDDVPIEWEHKWGHYIRFDWHHNKTEYIWFYDPFVWENHKELDPDDDGLDNVEEYMTSQWGSDPFRRDIFLELDQMEAGPNGEPASMLSNKSRELITTAFNRQNIVYHMDDGCMGGGEILPFIKHIPGWSEELRDLYNNSFLKGDENNWRRGVFHWGAMLYDAGFQGYNFMRGAFQVSTKCVNENQSFAVKVFGKDVALASVYMHEHGHSLGLNDIYGHNRDSYYPWQLNYWKFRPYKSCMNYGYTYVLVDYSDGSRGRNDMDDWEELDLTYFQRDL